MKKLPFSIDDLVEYLFLYENSSECDAFQDVSDYKHEKYIEIAENLIGSIYSTIDGNNWHSFDEMNIMLDLKSTGWNLPKNFLKNLLKKIICRYEFDFDMDIVGRIICNCNILLDSVKCGIFDGYIEKQESFLPIFETLEKNTSWFDQEIDKMKSSEFIESFAKEYNRCKRKLMKHK